MSEYIALGRFLHNHGTIATEGSPKSGLSGLSILLREIRYEDMHFHSER